MVALDGFFYRFEVDPYFFDGCHDGSGCRTGNDDFVADMQRLSLYDKLGDYKIGIVFKHQDEKNIHI